MSKVAQTFTPTTSLPYFVLVERESGISAADQERARGYLVGVPGLRFPDGRTVQTVLSAPPAAAIPSQDGKALLLPVQIVADKASEVVQGKTVLYQTAQALRQAAGTTLKPAGLSVYVTGPGGVFADFVTAFSGIDGILLVVALGVVLVILLVVYRSPVLPFAVLFTALFGLAAAGAVVYPLAKNGTLALNGQSQGILLILVVGAATDYSLLLVSRYREELHDHPSTWVAMRVAWRRAVEPIAASGATVILGLLCLLLSLLGNTRGLGPVGAIGIAGALLSALTFLPAVLLLFGRRIFWPRIPRVDHVHAEDSVGTSGTWGWVAGIVGRRPRSTWVVTLVALLACAAFLPTFKAQGITQGEIFLNKVESVTGQEQLARHFPAGSGTPTQIVARAAQADAVVRTVQADRDVASVVPTPGSDGKPKVVDGLVLLDAVLKPAADSPAAETVVERLRASLDAVGKDVLVGGATASNLDVRNASDRDLRVIVPAILAVILLVLIGLLRAVVAPLLLVAANVISFTATIGVSALVFNHVFHFPGSDPATPLYAFVFLVALGIDYSIFLMTRVREESVERGTRRGILVGLAVTGGVITSAGVVLAATFSALAVIPILFLAQIAFLVGFGVLLDTLVVRSLLVPALSHDIGSRIWWPGRLAFPPGRHEKAVDAAAPSSAPTTAVPSLARDAGPLPEET